MPVYINVDTAPGDVTSAGHEAWIEVSSLQWGVGRAITMPIGGASDREASAPSISEVTITKVMDKASPKLMQQALWGDGKLVKIDLVKTGTQLEVYAKYELENCLISGYSVSTGGDRPTESISFNFTKITYTFTEESNKNDALSPEVVGYDLGKAKTI